MLSKSYNDIQAEIFYKGGDAIICSFIRENSRSRRLDKKIKDVNKFQKNMTDAHVSKESF